MAIRVVVPPAVEPVSSEQAMLWCRAVPEDATLVDVLIQAAREHAENLTQRVFVERTMEWTGDGFASFIAWAPYGHAFAKWSPAGYATSEGVQLAAPVQSVTSVEYLDADGELQTLAPSAYSLDIIAEPAVLRYAAGTALPAVQSSRPDAVRIRFVAGYPVDRSDPDVPDYRSALPAALLAWMQVQVSTWYTQRESIATTLLTEPSRNYIAGLLDGLILSTRFV